MGPNLTPQPSDLAQMKRLASEVTVEWTRKNGVFEGASCNGLDVRKGDVGCPKGWREETAVHRESMAEGKSSRPDGDDDVWHDLA